MATTEVANWPGDVHGLMEPDLMARMKAHAARFDTEVISNHTVDEVLGAGWRNCACPSNITGHLTSPRGGRGR